MQKTDSLNAHESVFSSPLQLPATDKNNICSKLFSERLRVTISMFLLHVR